MEIKVKSKINASELYSFLIHHSYSSIWGFTGIIISVCALLAFFQLMISGGDGFSKVCTLVAALLFVFVQPIRLYLQAQRLVESDEGYKNPIEYVFSESGISLKQNTDSAFYAWGEVERVYSTKKILAIYINKKRVFKLSLKDINSDYEQVKEMIKTHAKNASVKIK